MTTIIPHITLLGAGPGSPDLITLRGIKALEAADVVLYDALVDTELLTYATNTELVFVGKRKGVHTYPQEKINELLVEYAKTKGHVVRLKGGDPFVFGRGLEEKKHAEKNGVSVDVIPGLSSSTSVPAAAGISLTHRSVADGFWVITGTKKDGSLSTDIELAAKSSSTLVVLMGMGKLKEIVSIFQKNNRGETPIGIIQNGTTPKEKIGIGTINNIVSVAEINRLSSPAIIVIGEVVRESKQLRRIGVEVEYNYSLN